MQLGIFAKTFAGSDPASVLRAARTAGFSVVQYNMACSGLPSLPKSIAPDVARALKAASETTGLSIAAVSATANLVHPDIAVRTSGIACVKAIIAAASLMGSSVVTLCTGTRDAADPWKHHPDNRDKAAWRDLHAAFDQLEPIAAQYDVMLGIEPEHGNIIADAALAHHFLTERSGAPIGIIFDPANLVTGHEFSSWASMIAAAIDMLGGHIIMAHAKDVNAQGHVKAAGFGQIDFLQLIHRLHGAKFVGPLITHGLDAADAPQVAFHLRQCAEQAGVPLT
jgi:sugar phosphate isomerase/epimerase